MTEQQEVALKVLGFIQSKARSNPEFKAKLLSGANDALTAEGIKVPEGVTVKFVEDTATLWHFVIQAPRGEGELTGDDLDQVAGGFQEIQMKQMGNPKQMGSS